MATAASSIVGGSATGHHILSAAERQAAQHALSRLGSSSNAKSPAASSKLLLGSGKETFATASIAKPATSISHDKAVSGSFATSSKGSTFNSDSIKVAGHTASAVKSDGGVKTATLTLSDKTTVTLTGVAAHNVIKTH